MTQTRVLTRSNLNLQFIYKRLLKHNIYINKMYSMIHSYTFLMQLGCAQANRHNCITSPVKIYVYVCYIHV